MFLERVRPALFALRPAIVKVVWIREVRAKGESERKKREKEKRVNSVSLGLGLGRHLLRVCLSFKMVVPAPSLQARSLYPSHTPIQYSFSNTFSALTIKATLLRTVPQCRLDCVECQQRDPEPRITIAEQERVGPGRETVSTRPSEVTKKSPSPTQCTFHFHTIVITRVCVA